jgi:hypothetical protein
MYVQLQTSAFVVTFDHFNDSPFVSTYRIPLKEDTDLSGTARIGTVIDVYILYMEEINDDKIIGTNAVIESGSITRGQEDFSVTVKETNDNIVGQFDWGNIILFAIGGVILAIGTILSYLCKEDTSLTRSGEE